MIDRDKALNSENKVDDNSGNQTGGIAAINTQTPNSSPRNSGREVLFLLSIVLLFQLYSLYVIFF